MRMTTSEGDIRLKWRKILYSSLFTQLCNSLFCVFCKNVHHHFLPWAWLLINSHHFISALWGAEPLDKIRWRGRNIGIKLGDIYYIYRVLEQLTIQMGVGKRSNYLWEWFEERTRAQVLEPDSVRSKFHPASKKKYTLSKWIRWIVLGWLGLV